MKHKLQTPDELRIYCQYENSIQHLHNVIKKSNPTHEEFSLAYNHWRDASNKYSDLMEKIKAEEEKQMNIGSATEVRGARA